MYKPSTAVWKPSASIIFKLSIITSALAALGLTTGCSTTPTAGGMASGQQSGMLDANSLNSLEDLLSATDMRAVEGDRLQILKHGDVWKRMTVGFKMDESNPDPRIAAQRGWFISRQPYLDRLSARASRYLYHTVKEAERRGLPTELALLPIIESSYDPAATSSAAAAGMWQFIPSTGRIYGLRQNNLYDGRRDVVESTRAAYEFLGSLYNQFGSWELALAAYNAGPGRIQQAINRNQAAGLPTDYWSLKLPQETMSYVPRFLAVAQIIKSPQNYGVSLPPIANRPHFREVAVPAGAQLNQIASITGMSRAELYALNPGHRGEVIDALSPQRILIPAYLNPNIDARLRVISGSGEFLALNTGNTASTVTTTPQPVASTSVSKVITPVVTTPTYTASSSVKVPTPVTQTTLKNTPQGSNALASFASNADVPSAPRIPVAINQAANIKPVSIEPPISGKEREQILAAVKAENGKETVQQILQPQATAAEKDEVVKEITALAPQGTQVVDPLDGKIKLTAIQTSQSVAEQQGKEVTVGFSYPKGVAENTPANSAEARLNQGKSFERTATDDVIVVPPKGKRSTYTVVAGDTLAIIATKNGVNWRDVANWNQVNPTGTLFVGTTLYLYDAKPVTTDAPSQTSNPQKVEKTTSYVVKPNDSLTAVAEQFGLSLQQLANYNNLSVSSNLLVGQKLSLVDNPNRKPVIENSSKEQKTTQRTEVKLKTKVYTVKRGEFLNLIANRYAMSNQELADLTAGLSADSSLLVGQKINVPLNEVNTQSTTAKAEKVEIAKPEITYKTENYKVQRGETLSSIAAQSKISLNALAELNKFSPNKGLLVGQSIKVPAGSITPENYTVQSGDSLTVIANKYDLSVSKLADLNGLSSSSGIQVGQKLKLTGEVVAPAAKTVKTSASKTSSKSTEKYVVKAGESLTSLAARSGVSVQELAEINDLTAKTSLRRGQTIQLPKTTVQYTVRSGDSLIRLASKYGLDTQALAEMNDMKPNASLRIGEVIKVPNL